eukprot:g6546.t1
MANASTNLSTNATVERHGPSNPSTDGGSGPSNGDKRRATTPQALASSQREVEFFHLIDYEIKRGAQFLALSEAQYVLKTRNVLDGYRSTQHFLQSPTIGLEGAEGNTGAEGTISCETAKEMWMRLMHACISVYTELLLLNHWVIVSYCGFSKILKKHDRRTGFVTKDKYLRHVVAKQHFTSYPKLHAMLRDMDVLFLHISRRLPQCPERMEGEAKINQVREVVAAAALQFSAHTDELMRSIQDHHRREEGKDPAAPNHSSAAARTQKGGRDNGTGCSTATATAAVNNNNNSDDDGMGGATSPAAAAAAAASLFCSVRGGVGAGVGARAGGKRRRSPSEENRPGIGQHQAETFLLAKTADPADPAAAAAGGLPGRRGSASSLSTVSSSSTLLFAGSGSNSNGDESSAAGGAGEADATTTGGAGEGAGAGVGAGVGVGVGATAAGLSAAGRGGLAARVSPRVTVRVRSPPRPPSAEGGGGGGGGELVNTTLAAGGGPRVTVRVRTTTILLPGGGVGGRGEELAAEAAAVVASAGAVGRAAADDDMVAGWCAGGADSGC